MKILILFLFVLIVPNTALAQISFDANGKWETTFDYAECIQRPTGGETDCATVRNDGITWNWGGNIISGNYVQVASAANYPGGSGNGFRAWVGDGQNLQSGGVRVSFPSPQTELWIRWYMRYQDGFQWLNNTIHYDKTLYIRTDLSNNAVSVSVKSPLPEIISNINFCPAKSILPKSCFTFIYC